MSVELVSNLMSLIDSLKESWFNLLSELSVTKSHLSNEIVTNLLNSYSAPIRHYHNLEHIEEILSLLTEVKEIAQEIRVLKLCAWFHDYIYAPQANNNEELSAIFAKKFLSQLEINSEKIHLTTQIIRSTKTHQPLLTSIDNLIFLDTDLAILGATKERYLQYAQGIRKEYQYLSDRDYCQGRTKVLTQFLSRDRIYCTDYFYNRLEQIARQNIQTEIEQLSRC